MGVRGGPQCAESESSLKLMVRTDGGSPPRARKRALSISGLGLSHTPRRCPSEEVPADNDVATAQNFVCPHPQAHATPT
jgi:hypothetical protein